MAENEALLLKWDTPSPVVMRRQCSPTSESGGKLANWDWLERKAYRQSGQLAGTIIVGGLSFRPEKFISNINWERTIGHEPPEQYHTLDGFIKPENIEPSDSLCGAIRAIPIQEMDYLRDEKAEYADTTPFNLYVRLQHHWRKHMQQRERFRLWAKAIGYAIPDDVLAFALRNGLLKYLDLAHKKVNEFFPNPRNLKTEFVTDPECDESWLSVRFITEGSLDDITAARKKYRRFWVRNVPVTKRLMIRLMYDID